MTTEQPAGQLARIKRENSLWQIRHVHEAFGYEALRDGYERVWAQTVPDLELELRDARKLNHAVTE